MQLPAMGYGLRYEYGMFKQSIRDGWQEERPDHWLRHQDPWQIMRPHESVEVKLNCSFEMIGGSLRAEVGKPARLFGVPRDLPIVGYGGRTINSLRLWAAAAPDYFDFQEFSHGDFVGALAEKLAAETLTRVLYPDDSTSLGRGFGSYRSTFSLPARWPISYGAFDAATPLELPSRQGRNPAQRHASNNGGVRVDEDSARRGEARMG